MSAGRAQEAPRWPIALQLLSDMERKGTAPDVVTYNSVINVLRWGGQRERAFDMLDGMNRRSAAAGGIGVQGQETGQAEAVRPDVITYNSAIAACAAGSG